MSCPGGTALAANILGNADDFKFCTALPEVLAVDKAAKQMCFAALRDPAAHSSELLCRPCEAGTFAKLPGSSICELCPDSMDSGGSATSCDIALCKEDLQYYDRPVAGEAGTCFQCEDGMDCVKFATLEGLPLEPGHWRTQNRSTDVVKCKFEKGCLSGSRPDDGFY